MKRKVFPPTVNPKGHTRNSGKESLYTVVHLQWFISAGRHNLHHREVAQLRQCGVQMHFSNLES